MDSLLIISLSESRRDPRVIRQLKTLSARWRVVVAGYGDPPEGAFRFIRLPRRLSPVEKLRGLARLAAGRYESFYWKNRRMQSALFSLRGLDCRLVLANDVDTLPLALAVAGGVPVLLDAHEYAPRQFEDRWLWRGLFQPYVEYLCRTYLAKAAGMFSVSRGIAEEYATVYGVFSRVLTNAADYEDAEPSPVADRRIRLIHHGRAIRSRHLEAMIEMMEYLDDRFTLDLMLMPNDPAYLRRIKRLSRSRPQIRFVDPVPMPEIIRTIAKYDVGVFLLPPVNFNYTHALPNKFFEFVQARLAIAIGPSPEMSALVRRHGLGMVADTFDPRNLAGQLNRLTREDLVRMKQAAHGAARELCADVNRRLLLEEVDRLVNADRQEGNNNHE